MAIFATVELRCLIESLVVRAFRGATIEKRIARDDCLQTLEAVCVSARMLIYDLIKGKDGNKRVRIRLSLKLLATKISKGPKSAVRGHV